MGDSTHTKDTYDCSDKTDGFNEFAKPYHFIRDNYFGDGGYDPNKEYSFLRRFDRESQENYQDRREITILNNVFNPLQNLYLTPIYATTSDVDVKTQNQDLLFVAENAEMITNANYCLRDFRLYDKTFFTMYVDYIENDDGLEIDSNTVLEIEPVFPGDITSVTYEGIKISTMEYILEKDYKNVTVPIECIYDGSTNMFKMKTMAWLTKDGKVTLTDLGEEKRITEFDGLKYGTADKIGEGFKYRPDSFALARMQKELFQLESFRTEILTKVAFPILTIATDQEITDISLSVNNILKVPSEVTRMPEYLESDLTSCDTIKETIDEKKEFIYKMFTSNLWSDNIKNVSATATLISSKNFQAEIETLYNTYQEIIKKMVENIIFIYSINTPMPTIEYGDLAMFDGDTIKEEVSSIL